MAEMDIDWLNKNKKSRGWVVTCNNYTERNIEEFNILALSAQYSICGKEVGEQGTPHLQGYLYFKSPRSWKSISTSLPRCYVERAKGNPAQNREYCSKSDDFIETGKIPQQGRRVDLEEKCEEVKNGKSVDEIALEDPVAFHQYGRTLERIETIRLRQQWRTEMTKGVWYWGPPGVGKTHHVMADYHPDTHYIKNLNDEWWDGYKGQQVVVLNEFRGQIPFSELLDLVDKWPKTVKQRCREPVPFLAKLVLISCVKHPKDVYVRQEGEPWAQFDRRFEVIELMEQK